MSSLAWSVDLFGSFWKHPDPNLVPAILTEDVVGHWAGLDEPVRGREPYTACIAALVQALPDVRVIPGEHAQAGDVTFLSWELRATGRRGPFAVSGIDRIRTRDGLVTENVVMLDTATFEARAGMPVPWCTPAPLARG